MVMMMGMVRGSKQAMVRVKVRVREKVTRSERDCTHLQGKGSA
jgi:hypothetical protein